MTNVKTGVVGCGSLGRHHVRILSEMESVELVGLFDVQADIAEALAREYGCRAFDTLEALADAVDSASVVVPTDLHRDVAGVLLEQGVHLLVEKPIAATSAEAAELVALAREKNLVLQVGHIERYNPVMGYLEDLGGKPRFIEAHRLAPYPPPRDGLVPRGTEVSVILDLMIHDLEVILHLVNSELTGFHAVGIPVLSPSEDICNVRLQFTNGCVANITASRISPEPMRKIRVFFDDAYMSLDYGEQTGKVHRKSLTGIEVDDVPIEKGDALTIELRDFNRCVAEHGDPKVSGEHASRALRLADEIMQHVQTTSS